MHVQVMLELQGFLKVGVETSKEPCHGSLTIFLNVRPHHGHLDLLGVVLHTHVALSEGLKLRVEIAVVVAWNKPFMH